MKSSTLKTNKNSFKFADEYTINPIKIIDIPRFKEYIKANKNMFYMKDVIDNVRFEVLAYKEYGTDSSLWDILFLLNYGEYGFMNFVKDNDWVQNVIDDEFTVEKKFYGYNYNEERLKNQISNKIIKKNDINRKVIFIKQEYISKFKDDIKEFIISYTE